MAAVGEAATLPRSDKKRCCCCGRDMSSLRRIELEVILPIKTNTAWICSDHRQKNVDANNVQTTSPNFANLFSNCEVTD